MTDLSAIAARQTLARPDLATLALEGLVPASAYRATRPMHGAMGVADIHEGPSADHARIDQLLAGEAFDVLEAEGDWAWGQARRDGTVGWVMTRCLAAGAPVATHRVAAADAVLPLNALVHHAYSGVTPEALKPVGEFETDPVAVAERLIGVPHALGARSSRLTDCSGLVQQALHACGRAGPRHSDEQALLGAAVSRQDLRRGDLVIWLAPDGETAFTGHSALAIDGETVIHATGFHGGVVTEPLAEAEARYASAGFQPPVFRRPD